mgnify:CR=1 FL=1
MTTKTSDLQEVEKKEVEMTEGTEHTRVGKVYVPKTDIYETNDGIVVVADMPGVDEGSIDITLEKNVLDLKGYIKFEPPTNYNLAYAEYDIGNYERKFTISDEVDRENIEATIKDGVLRLHLPKAAPAKARKIAVKGM